MGMFDKETQLKHAPFLETDPHSKFMLWEGEYLGMTEHKDYGTNTKARVKAGPVNGSSTDAEYYVVFGVMADQIGRMESGDLPARVKIIQDGRANVLARSE